MSCRLARWRIRCHVRSRPPLSSGSSRSDFSQRIRMSGRSGGLGERLDAVAVDERAIPELQVHEGPDAIAAFGAAGGVIAQHPVDGGRLEDAALARAAIEQDVA